MHKIKHISGWLVTRNSNNLKHRIGNCKGNYSSSLQYPGHLKKFKRMKLLIVFDKITVVDPGASLASLALNKPRSAKTQ